MLGPLSLTLRQAFILTLFGCLTGRSLARQCYLACLGRTLGSSFVPPLVALPAGAGIGAGLRLGLRAISGSMGACHDTVSHPTKALSVAEAPRSAAFHSPALYKGESAADRPLFCSATTKARTKNDKTWKRSACVCARHALEENALVPRSLTCTHSPRPDRHPRGLRLELPTQIGGGTATDQRSLSGCPG